MKRKLLGFLCVCMLLSGCGISSPKPVQTESPTTETLVAEIPAIPLLEQGAVLAESGNLLYIPSETIEGMTNPEMRLLGNGLLLSEYREQEMILHYLSLEDGALVTSASVPAGFGTKLYIGNGEIGLCDWECGVITILDEAFRAQKTYEVPREGDEWYLNAELDTLYIFFSDRGLLARNLETGEAFWLVDHGFRVTPVSSGNGYVIFTYTDRADQKTYSRYLNLSTATLETLPVGGTVHEVTRQGETWLIRDREADGRYSLVHGETVQSFSWTDSAVRLLSPKRHLLATDSSGRNLMLFESDGRFISQCSLPMSSHAMTGSDFVWSGYWEGYFFTDFLDGTYRLMFWDVSADCEGENLQMLPMGEAQQSQPVVEASLYERAAQLSQRFDVDIRIAEQCSLDYTNYRGYVMTNPEYIRLALDMLENALSKYPEGFFRQLCYGSVESIRIELVEAPIRKENTQNQPDAITGFAQNMGSYYLIVLDGYLTREGTVFHELSHVIDKRLEWDSLIREDALYSEEVWLALQPQGFRYTYSYVDFPEEMMVYVETGDFVSDYSMTNPTEDRAELMEYAMQGQIWAFEPGSGRRAKLQYYADCIRDCFDTTGWPEITLWEQMLH